MIKDLLRRVPGAPRLARLIRDAPDPRQFLLDMLPRNSICAEIGVHEGGFSQQILRALDPKELHLIDPWKYETADAYQEAQYGGTAQGGQMEMDGRYGAVCARFEPETRAGRLKIHRGYSNAILGGFPDEYFDWIYIDGNHLYEFVMRDLDVSIEKVKPGGYIAGDDYAEGGWWRGGVKEAVDAFVRKNAIALTTARNRQFVLKKETIGCHAAP